MTAFFNFVFVWAGLGYIGFYLFTDNLDTILNNEDVKRDLKQDTQEILKKTSTVRYIVVFAMFGPIGLFLGLLAWLSATLMKREGK